MYAIQMGKGSNDVFITTLTKDGYDYGRRYNSKKWKTRNGAENGLKRIRKINPLGAPCCYIVEV